MIDMLAEMKKEKLQLERRIRAIDAYIETYTGQPTRRAGNEGPHGRVGVRGNEGAHGNVGVRTWTDAQRKALSRRMKKFHASKKKGQS